jgi:hypothetical protein
MATRTIKTVFQVRRDTTENWELYSEIIPAAGEPCYDLDLKTLRIGDGVTFYKDLPVIGGVENAKDLQVAIDKLQEQIGEADVSEMQESVTQLNTQFTAIQETLDTKVEAEAVEAMATDLKTYVDEKIKKVEVENIDDGEI